MRRIGPRLRGHRIAREQVAVAYPQMPPAEIERVLSGMWDNLGRIGAEYVHLDRIWDFKLDGPAQGRIVLDERTIEQCRRLLARRGPALMFGAHIGAWEVSALAARIFAPNVSVIYKAPRIKPIADAIEEVRRSSGAVLLPADPTTTLRIRDALKRGHMVGMLVDEHYADGIEVTMFNRPFRINPLFARFVRIFECPFHGFHVVRLPDGRLRLDVTGPVEAPRDTTGRIDVAATMQTIVSTIEGWVRANPEQMFWMHRRWR
jgi:KDO2-lipid IV(A) lauroyltransferase